MGEHALAPRGKGQAYRSVVRGVRLGPDEARFLRSVDKLARTVVPKQELFRDLADRWGSHVAQALDHHEELVLGGRDALGLGRIVAPSEEPPERRTEGKKLRIVHIHSAGVHVNISYHDIS